MGHPAVKQSEHSKGEAAAEHQPERREHVSLTAQALTVARPRDTLAGEALVVRADVRSDRYGHPYVAMTLLGSDNRSIEARWWKFPSGEACPAEGTVYWFEGSVDTFNGVVQLCVTSARVVPDADLSIFAKSTKRPEVELIAELEATIATLDASLSALVRIVLSGETYTRFCRWPAAQLHHGAVRHGLLAHSLRVAALAERIATSYETTAVSWDRSVAIAAALLHDVGKIHTLPALAGTSLPDTAHRFDHVTLGALMVQDAAKALDAPLDPIRQDALIHAILAHHGRREWGAPIEPQTVEAWLVHLADLAEARLWPYTDDARE